MEKMFPQMKLDIYGSGKIPLSNGSQSRGFSQYREYFVININTDNKLQSQPYAILITIRISFKERILLDMFYIVVTEILPTPLCIDAKEELIEWHTQQKYL